MAPTPTDELARALATPTSRRKALQVLAAFAGASALSALPVSFEISGLDAGALAALAKQAQAPGGTKPTGRLVPPSSPDYESARLGGARQYSRFPLVIVFCQ